MMFLFFVVRKRSTVSFIWLQSTSRKDPLLKWVFANLLGFAFGK